MQVPIGGQPHDIERQIRDMVIKYIRSPKAIILAVTAANTDLANSDGLKLAREVDPEGTRTIGVLTKVDLMDPGTDVVDILAGRVIPLQMGQKDIDGKKTIISALDNERRFFESHPAYQAKSAYCGTPFLAKKLNLVLINHIRNTLPDIKRGLSSSILKFETELSSLGDGSELGQATILSVITEFCDEYRSMLDGSSSDAISTELVGGARIGFIFHEIFANAIRSMDPFDQIKDQDIRTLLYNSTGSSPSLFVPFNGFGSLIKGLIKRLDDPASRCIALVYEELSKILLQLLQKPIFKRFPNLREKFHNSVMSGLKKCADPTTKFVGGLILAESSYINTVHPDFLSGHKV
ncbi:hypothetical protein DI09_12p330 [Mitosporidium daphniae]|uniref:Dynamin-type G domain-containing protein n=1 Tax=Mitosporidium daphniae TaxID=1485682 RepID=A0A098VVF2_9MICR|nr:uncharacterized protein DI09_12p330 [Mitosporidium daphniae]KGG52865.1 hypothetical protein DI09_12p330 [Mitosporidium daphniae]|eukprot:XP_013239292.1 uncharacterized protein DI09_12p330 [Mitosporidium daphniae]